MRRWIQLLAAPLALTVGCAGSTAIISRPDGPPVEAEIDSSDASTLRLRAPGGSLVPLDQHQVSDIDHPGNVWAMIGLGYAAAGGLSLLTLLVPENPGDGYKGTHSVVGFLGICVAITGLSVFLYNIALWERSKSRARAFENARPPEWFIPPAAPGVPQPIVPLPSEDETDGDEPPSHGFHR
jgi:hypothetical protein